MMGFGKLFHFVIVNKSGLGVSMVRHRVVRDTGERDRGSVCQMAAAGKVKAQDSVTGVEYSGEDSHVGLRAGVGLDVGIRDIEEFFERVLGNSLYFIDYLASAVVAVSGIAFSIFVCQAGAECAEDISGDIVLGCDEFDTDCLALVLFCDFIENILYCCRHKKMIFDLEF